MASKNTLSIDNLHCIRGERQLFDQLSLNVSSGQCLHIIGANGCGKSSLLRIISGLSAADSGQVFWNQIVTHKNQDFFNDSAFIGHKDALKNELTAIENLRFNQQLNVQENTNEDQLDDCLSKMQILQCADLTAQKLSFGQRRRLTFANLLLRPYKIWILDEPFTGIDKDGRKVIENVCLDHLNNAGIIILTHHQSLQNSALKDFLIEFELDKYSSNIAGNEYE